MTAWGEARYAGRTAGQRHAPGPGAPIAVPRWLDDVQKKYNLWYMPLGEDRMRHCFFCRSKSPPGGLVTGNLPGIGAIAKCKRDDCANGYNLLRQAIDESNKE